MLVAKYDVKFRLEDFVVTLTDAPSPDLSTAKVSLVHPLTAQGMDKRSLLPKWFKSVKTLVPVIGASERLCHAICSVELHLIGAMLPLNSTSR